MVALVVAESLGGCGTWPEQPYERPHLAPTTENTVVRIADLLDRSDFVIIGLVKNSTSVWSTKNGPVPQDAEIEVYRVLAGAPPSETMTVRIQAGYQMPWRKGDYFVLFLKQAEVDTPFVITGDDDGRLYFAKEFESVSSLSYYFSNPKLNDLGIEREALARFQTTLNGLHR